MGFKTIATAATSFVGVYMFFLWTLDATRIINWFVYALPRMIVGTIVFSIVVVAILAVVFYSFFGLHYLYHGNHFPHHKYVN